MKNTHYTNAPDGTRLAYDINGQGPALILLHGAGKDRRDWHKLGYVDRLKNGFTVIALDLRGSGESDFLAETSDYAIEKICADVNAVADACGAAQYLIWGYSFGGNIARYLAAWSARVQAIAVIGVPFGPAVHADFDQFITEFVTRWGPSAEAYRTGGLSPVQHKSAIKGRIPALVACFQAMRGWPGIAPGDVRCPALLLAGTRNKGTVSWIEANRPALERARLEVVIVDGLDHPQEFTQVERVYPLVAAFLQEQAR